VILSKIYGMDSVEEGALHLARKLLAGVKYFFLMEMVVVSDRSCPYTAIGSSLTHLQLLQWFLWINVYWFFEKVGGFSSK
jgi:hypothetical protein